ncbi:hypothetical protein J1G42_11915 [Cellulomonas sp. zg-ZUI222]|uniref:Uncharacterized protein n=1 Tax=Cellulomonas wangleii TaxID=2816956 RepID=A0ABX8D7Y5_9CELL|nr:MULTISPECIES: hypothetical protein [Cellulomonas]MBO0900874.1 hypothetical protein [Cellulomonas sp. zg-ZUI22]MBO0921529.1 hypothetical protein [Cellulomonas wangleii]MBO0925025.1 hypothetical protein [Cellulomonas wangleii]QVI63555.1 hypothetical protein KG103_06760 [Cellulomonas wangleii]
MDERIPADDPGRAQEAGAGAEGVPAPDENVMLPGLDAAQHAQELLAEHVPLTLLVDLLAPTGQTSEELLAAEGLPEDAWWSADGGTPTGA